MLQLLKYTFYRIYFWYQSVFGAQREVHYYSSFILSLLLFGNVFLVVTIFSLLTFRQLFFEDLLTFYIILGNILVFSMLIFVSAKRRYVKILEDCKNVSGVEKERLNNLSSRYIIISFIPLLAFIVFQFVFI
jgi:hypothetical protein